MASIRTFLSLSMSSLCDIGMVANFLLFPTESIDWSRELLRTILS